MLGLSLSLSLARRSAGFDPITALFSDGAEGLAWNTRSLMFTNSERGRSAGVGDPVGAIVGGEKALGPNILTNGTFDTGSDGWTLLEGWSWSGGQMAKAPSTGTHSIVQDIVLEDAYYVATVEFVSLTGPQPRMGVRLEGASATSVISDYIDTEGVHKFLVKAVPGHTEFRVTSNQPETGAVIDNVSLQKVESQVMTQTVNDNFRPTLRSDHVDCDGVDDYLEFPFSFQNKRLLIGTAFRNPQDHIGHFMDVSSDVGRYAVVAQNGSPSETQDAYGTVHQILWDGTPAASYVRDSMWDDFLASSTLVYDLTCADDAGWENARQGMFTSGSYSGALETVARVVKVVPASGPTARDIALAQQFLRASL